MTQLYYIAALIVAMTCLALLDYRYKLAFWHSWRPTLKTLALSGLIFIIWDFLGIAQGIFYSGGSRYALPFELLPEFPLEELFFITLLCYSTLITYRGVQKWQTT